MPRRADGESVEDAQRKIAKLDEDINSRQDASRQIERIEEETLADQHKRANQIDQISYLWSGPEAVSYMRQSVESYLSEMRSIRSMMQYAQDDLKTEMHRLNQRKEMFLEDIDHIQRTRQIEDEDASDG